MMSCNDFIGHSVDEVQSIALSPGVGGERAGEAIGVPAQSVFDLRRSLEILWETLLRNGMEHWGLQNGARLQGPPVWGLRPHFWVAPVTLG